MWVVQFRQYEGTFHPNVNHVNKHVTLFQLDLDLLGCRPARLQPQRSACQHKSSLALRLLPIRRPVLLLGQPPKQFQLPARIR